MKNIFNKWYSTNLGRIIRRGVVAGVSAVAGYLMATGKVVVTPEGLVDSVFALNGADAVFALKLFIGSGVIAAVDKMRREGVWNWLTDKGKTAIIAEKNASVDSSVGEK